MITAIIGECGSGKSLLMAYLMLKDKLNYNKPVYSNLYLTYNFLPLHRSFFKNYNDFPIFSASIGLDEIHVYFPSRNPFGKKNINFSEFITQTRKRKLQFYYTTQEAKSGRNPAGMVDVNIRDRTDIFIFTRMKVSRDGKVFINKPDEWDEIHNPLRDSYLLIYDIYDRNLRFIKRKKIYRAEKLFSLYDSYKIITFNDDEEKEK